jgi:uncharacterized protein YndB with AHSA1/START domain
MEKAVEEAVVRKSVRVKVPVERAFKVFVEQMETWWPATHHIGKTPFVALFVEPRVGGRWYEQNVKGELCDWGRVLKWDPPHLVVLSWHVGPKEHENPEGEWGFDADLSRASEVEIKFIPDGKSATLVELTHSKLERHGEGYEKLRAMFDGPTAWAGILDLFAQKVDAQEGVQG